MEDLACPEGGTDWVPLGRLMSGPKSASNRTKSLAITCAFVGLAFLGGLGIYGYQKKTALAAEAAAIREVQTEAVEEFKRTLDIQNNVLDQLLRLNSICEMGTNRLNYSSLLVQVKPEVDSLLRSYPTRADRDFAKHASGALEFYVQAQNDWENAPTEWAQASGQIKLASLRRDLTTAIIAAIIAFPQKGLELWSAYERGTMDDSLIQKLFVKEQS